MPLGTNKWVIETYLQEQGRKDNFLFCTLSQLPYSREQKHVLFSDMSRILTPPKTWFPE